MRTLTTVEWLKVWDQGQLEPPAHRALLLLSAVHGASPEEVMGWSIGRRDKALLQTRERFFGVELPSRSHCPACREQVEFQLKTSDLLNLEVARAEDLVAKWDKWEADFRLPTSADLAALTTTSSTEEHRQFLLTRCVQQLRCRGKARDWADAPVEIKFAIEARMAEADPHAELKLDLHCPACSHRWQAVFDVVSYFWAELNAWAARLLRQVHVLAASYGWREDDILAMGAVRRQAYLNLLGA